MLSSIHLLNNLQILQQLRPITDHRPLADILIGASTIANKWEVLAKKLSTKSSKKLNILGSCLPNETLIEALEKLEETDAIYYHDIRIAFYENEPENRRLELSDIEIIQYPEDILFFHKHYISEEIKKHTDQITNLISSDNTLIVSEECYIHKTATIKGSILDASLGPIYIGANVNIQIGTLIQGPAVILENSTTNLGTKIRPFTTIGKNCKVGGEISYSIIHEGTNKAHDGYLGNSIIGSFCNFGALTNSSNVRNDLKPVKLFDYKNKTFRQTNCNSIGLITGDYITTGISSQFNTATVIGSHCNITSLPFPDKYIPSFTWGVSTQFKRYEIDQAIENATRWALLKNQSLTTETINRMQEIWKEL